MTPAAKPAIDQALLPSRGMQAMLEDVPGGPWLTTIDGMADEGASVLFAPPRLGGKVVRLPLRRVARVSYSLSDVPCEIDAEIVSGPDDGEGSYTARVVGGPRRMQRRTAVRVPINLLAHASTVPERPGDRPADIGAVTENLSGGGALLRSSEPLAAGSVLTVTVECGGSVGTVTLSGRVVRCDNVDAGDHPWRVAIAFVDPPVATQDKLVRFLFERQRELRRRESGLA